MKLLGSTKSKTTKDKNIPYLEYEKALSIHCNVLVIGINKIQESCINLFLINFSVTY